MTTFSLKPHKGILKRVLWLYGIHALLFNSTYLLGYYLLPEGWMQGSPQVAVGRLVASATSFWSEFALTLLFNLGLATVISVLMNLQQVKGFPVGYLMPIILGITSGLISGTNSFAASDLTRYNARDGMALGLSIGGVEMLGYILIIASTVKLGVYQYHSWWRWGGKWKPTKTMNLRDVRLARSEVICLVIGILLVIFAAYRETLMAMSS